MALLIAEDGDVDAQVPRCRVLRDCSCSFQGIDAAKHDPGDQDVVDEEDQLVHARAPSAAEESPPDLRVRGEVSYGPANVARCDVAGPPGGRTGGMVRPSAQGDVLDRIDGLLGVVKPALALQQLYELTNEEWVTAGSFMDPL